MQLRKTSNHLKCLKIHVSIGIKWLIKKMFSYDLRWTVWQKYDGTSVIYLQPPCLSNYPPGCPINWWAEKCLCGQWPPQLAEMQFFCFCKHWSVEMWILRLPYMKKKKGLVWCTGTFWTLPLTGDTWSIFKVSQRLHVWGIFRTSEL